MRVPELREGGEAMSYKKEHLITYTCDVCGIRARVIQHDSDLRNTKAQLRKKGWTFGKQDKCWSCSGKAVKR